MVLMMVIAGMSSCSVLSITKGRMLKAPVDFDYSAFDTTELVQKYRIAVDDAIMLRMYANDGYNFVALEGGANNQQNNLNRGANVYKVRSDSTVKMPIIGRVKVVGMTLDEVETHFEGLLQSQFQDPFVTAEISNRRIFVFSGLSSAAVYVLQNENTTLFEVLANSGGMPAQSNASKIKIIRGDLKDPKIYLVDLSTIDGMKAAELTMQAGDVVYIDPFINYGSIFTTEVTGLLSIISTSLLVYTLFNGGN